MLPQNPYISSTLDLDASLPLPELCKQFDLIFKQHLSTPQEGPFPTSTIPDPRTLRHALRKLYRCQSLFDSVFYDLEEHRPLAAPREVRCRKRPFTIDLTLCDEDYDLECDPNEGDYCDTCKPSIAKFRGREYELSHRDGTFWDSDSAYGSESEPAISSELRSRLVKRKRRKFDSTTPYVLPPFKFPDEPLERPPKRVVRRQRLAERLRERRK